MPRTPHTLPSILSITMLLLSAVGCAGGGSNLNRTFGTTRSFHLQGERVSLEFYDHGDPEMFGAGAVIGLVVDLVEEGLRKEAARYTQSYAATGYHETNQIPRGFRVTRTITNPGLGNCDGSADTGDESPASTVSIALAQLGTSRLYELKVDEFQVMYSKAKVSQFARNGTIDVDLAVTVEGLWTDANGQYQKQNLTIGGGATLRDVDICTAYKDDHTTKNPSLGYVYIPKIDGATSGLVLQATVAVTERDSSRAAKTIINGADLLKKNRENIINGATGLLGESVGRLPETSEFAVPAALLAERALMADRAIDEIQKDGYRFGSPAKGWIDNGLKHNFLLEENGLATRTTSPAPIEAFFTPAPERVCWPDDRAHVIDAETAPWNAMCRLEITLPNGNLAVGSGWLLTPRLVVTAGHCVHGGLRGTYFSSVDVIPGPNGSTEPYGRMTSTNLRASQGWIQFGSMSQDYGAIILDRPFGSDASAPSPLAMRVVTGSELEGNEAMVSGYPADRATATQWFDFDTITRVHPDQLEYRIDTYGGQSGSPVMHNGEAVAIHNYGGGYTPECTNFATRITPEVRDQLLAWAREAGTP